MSTADTGNTPPNDGTTTPPADGATTTPDYAGYASVEELVAAHKALKSPPEPSKNADLAIKPKDDAGDAAAKACVVAPALKLLDDFLHRDQPRLLTSCDTIREPWDSTALGGQPMERVKRGCDLERCRMWGPLPKLEQGDGRPWPRRSI